MLNSRKQTMSHIFKEPNLTTYKQADLASYNKTQRTHGSSIKCLIQSVNPLKRQQGPRWAGRMRGKWGLWWEWDTQKKIRICPLILSPSGAVGFSQILSNSINLNPTMSPSELITWKKRTGWQKHRHLKQCWKAWVSLLIQARNLLLMSNELSKISNNVP